MEGRKHEDVLYSNMSASPETFGVDLDRTDCWINTEKRELALDYFSAELQPFIHNYGHQGGFFYGAYRHFCSSIQEKFLSNTDTAEITRKKVEFYIFSDTKVLFIESFYVMQYIKMLDGKVKHGKNQAYKIRELPKDIEEANAEQAGFTPVANSFYYKIVKEGLSSEGRKEIAIHYAVISPHGNLKWGRIKNGEDGVNLSFLLEGTIADKRDIKQHLSTLLNITANRGHTRSVLPIAKIVNMALIEKEASKEVKVRPLKYMLFLFDEAHKDILFFDPLQQKNILERYHASVDEVNTEIDIFVKNTIMQLNLVFSQQDEKYQSPAWFDVIKNNLLIEDETKIEESIINTWIETDNTVAKQRRLLNKINQAHRPNKEINELILGFLGIIPANNDDAELIRKYKCINRALLRPSVASLFALHNLISDEEATISSRKKGTASSGFFGTVATGGLFAASMLNPATAAAVGFGMFAASTAATLVVSIEGDILKTARILLNQLLDQLSEEQQYLAIASYHLSVILDEVKKRGTKNAVRDTLLSKCASSITGISTEQDPWTTLLDLVKILGKCYRKLKENSSSSKAGDSINELKNNLIQKFYQHILSDRNFDYINFYSYILLKFRDIKSSYALSAGEQIEITNITPEINQIALDVQTYMEKLRKHISVDLTKKCPLIAKGLQQLADELTHYLQVTDAKTTALTVIEVKAMTTTTTTTPTTPTTTTTTTTTTLRRS